MDLFASGDGVDDEITDLGSFFGESDASASASGSNNAGAYSVAPSSPRAGTFVGLQNQGATCYLNSLIVSLYMTPEIRRGLYSLTPADLVVPLTAAEITAEDEKNVEPPVDPVALEALCGMGFEEAQVKRAIRKFPNDPDNMQRVEFILSGDADKDPPAAAGPAAPEIRVKERRIPKELQTLFARMQASNTNGAQSTKRLTDCFGAGFSGGVQHDVHELNRILFDRIEKQLRGTPVHGLINRLYRGTVVNRILCKSCGHKSEREEEFLDLSLVVGDFANVEESLASSVTDEELSGDNMYECSGCKKKVDALKGARIRSVPPVLILSLSRFEYDKRTWQRVKNSKSFPFPEVLDMAPFMEQGSDVSNVVYELFGVVIHRGDQASHGHYHAYLLDVLNESKAVGGDVLASEEEPSFAGWFDFNDSIVRPVSLATVRTQYGGSANRSECAYMLIYRQKNCPLLSEVKEVPALPEQLGAEITKENEEIQRKRAEWEEMKNKIEIVLHIPTMLEMGVGETIRIVAGKDKEEEDDDDDDDEELRLTRPYKILIDRRQTLRDLKVMAQNVFGPLVPDASEMQMHRIRVMGSDQRVKFLRPLDRPMAPDGKEVICDDSATLDSLSTVTHGCDVLVWDGVQLFGRPFEVAYDLITLEVAFYDEQDKSSKFSILVKEGATLGELCNLLRVQCGLQESDPVQIFRLDYAKAADLNVGKNPSKTLREVYLNDHSKISVEKYKSESEESRTVAALRLAEEARSVFVTNNCDATVVSEAVRCTLGMTVWDLKNILIKRIGTLNERMPMRLRRCAIGGGEGALFADEGATLRKAGIEDNVRVILEYGEPPDATNITVKFMWGSPSGQKLLGEMQNLCVEVTMTLKELKARMMDALHLESPPSSYRVRKTDYWGLLKEIFDDEDKTLKQLSFTDSACVWLEEGVIPPKGMMELQIELQTAVEMPTGASANAADVWETNPVAVLQAMKTATLAELRKQIRDDPVLGAVVGARPFRVWSKGSKLLRGEDKTLKRLGVVASCVLCIQVLHAEAEVAELVAADGNGVVVLLRRRLVEQRNFAAPIESVLKTQRRANQTFVRRSDLIQHILTVGGVADPEPRLLVAKLVAQSGRWKVLIDPMEEDPEPVAVDTGKSVGKKERKRADEVFVGDGDLLVWKLCSDDPNGLDDVVSMLNKQYGDAYVSTRTERSAAAAAGSSDSGARNKPKEIGLQISDDGW